MKNKFFTLMLAVMASVGFINANIYSGKCGEKLTWKYPQSAPAVYTNPANPTQKLIRNGNVYVLTGDKLYTITGQAVK